MKLILKAGNTVKKQFQQAKVLIIETGRKQKRISDSILWGNYRGEKITVNPQSRSRKQRASMMTPSVKNEQSLEGVKNEQS